MRKNLLTKVSLNFCGIIMMRHLVLAIISVLLSRRYEDYPTRISITNAFDIPWKEVIALDLLKINTAGKDQFFIFNFQS